MSSPADRTIDALRATHEELAAVVPGLSDQQLDATSGASEWTVAQVLSHLGSGAEITLATLQAAMGSAPGPGPDFNQSVWDRWNAMSPREQADGFLTGDAELLAAIEALTAGQRQSLSIDVGFFPAPLPLAAYLGMRLNEAGQHSWDVRVSLDPGAAIAAATAAVIAEHFATDLGFLLGFTGKADALAQSAVVDIHESGYAIVIAESVSITTSAPPATATFNGPLEAAVRLLGGRLTSRYTPAGLQVRGNVTLDDLRRVFPGY
jgi:uncharacterized protein (TIGR03083 family)